MLHTVRPGVLVQPTGRLRRVFVLLLLGAFTSALVLVNTLRPWPPMSPFLAANFSAALSSSSSSSFSSSSSSSSSQSEDLYDQNDDTSLKLFTLFASKPSKPFLADGQSQQHFLPLTNHRRLLAQRNAHLLSLIRRCEGDSGWLQLWHQLDRPSSNEQVERLLLQLNHVVVSGRQLVSCFDRWQSVSGSPDFFQVFSAYIDLRAPEQRVVRIVATTKTRSKLIFYCVHWLPMIPCSNCSSTVTANLQGRSYLTLGVGRAIRENWSLPYSAFYLQCPLPTHLQLPLAVSVLVGAGEAHPDSGGGWPRALHPLSNLLIIANHLRLQPASWFDQNSSTPGNNFDLKKPKQPNNQTLLKKIVWPNHKLTKLALAGSNDYNQSFRSERETLGGHLAICVKPIHYDYDQLGRLIEFLSLNRLLGVSHFVLYVQSMGPHVRCLLQQQVKQWDTLTLLPWQGLRPTSQTEIRTQNLFAALNDCSMRLVGRFRYVAMIDLDEFIIPRMDDTLLLMLHRLHVMDRQSPAAGAYSFQNAFFYLGWADDGQKMLDENFDDRLKSQPNQHDKIAHKAGQTVIRSSDLTVKSFPTITQQSIQPIVLSKTQRRADLHPHRQRSKLIVRPDALLEVGNHFVWQFVNGFGAVHVHSRAALLHHYRVCEFGGLECLKSSSVQDRRAHHWASSLNIAMKDLYANYSKVCSALGPIPNG